MNSHVFFKEKPRPTITHGQGIFLYDQAGRRYLDAIGGTHLNSIGYGVKAIGEAMARQAEQIHFVHKVQFTTEVQERLADHIIEVAPQGMYKVAFATGGSIANELALLIARYYHLARGHKQKYKIIGRLQSYHGRTIASLSMSGSLFVKQEDMAPYKLDFPHIVAPHCYQCPLQKQFPSCNLACADELAHTIEKESPEQIAAFIAEPIVGGAGSAITPPPGYYERIRQICDHYDILFIAEEVITGFGRTGQHFGCQHWAATPDIITSAKGLSSGYAPIGVTMVHEHIWQTLVEQGYDDVPAWVTYSGHPVSCAAALAVQTYIAEHQLVAQCANRGAYLTQKLQTLAEQQPLIGNIRGKGLLIGLEFVQDRASHQPFPREQKLTEKLIQIAFKRGLILRGRFGTGLTRDGDHILLSPPFIISESECDELVALLADCLQQVQAQLKL